MTPRQRELARHALGLNEVTVERKSYRNRFHTHNESPDWKEWNKMVENGDATRTLMKRKNGKRPPDYLFEMTHEGAVKALKPGESLCREGFPIQGR